MDRGLAFILLLCLLLFMTYYSIDKNIIINEVKKENQELRMQVFELNYQLEREVNEK
jgi:hypothetical protein